jgi:beta propeller repeat protein
VTPGYCGSPDVSGDRFVWVWWDTSWTEDAIYLFDVSEGVEEKIIDLPGEQSEPHISGDWVVFSDWGSDADGDIKAFNVATDEMVNVCSDPARQEWPDISGDWIYYEDKRNGGYDIYGFNLASRTEKRMTTDANARFVSASASGFTYVSGSDLWFADSAGNNFYPVEYGQVHWGMVSDDWVVFGSDEDLDGTPEVYMWEVVSATGDAEAITFTNEPYVDREQMSLSGTTLTYVHDNGADWDVYAKDLISGTETLVTGARAYQSSPTIDGTTIGWSDDRSYNSSNRIEIWANVDTGAIVDEPPSTSIAVDRPVPNGDDGWYLFGVSGGGSAPLITLTADEPATTYYHWDAELPEVYSEAIPMRPGQHTLTYWSEDGTGNVEDPVNTVVYKYDNRGPSAPPNLTAEALSPTSIRLSWDASTDAHSGVRHYVIDRKLPLPYARIGQTPDAGTTYDVSGLEPGTEYTFVVFGQDVARWGGSASEVVITTPAATSDFDLEDQAAGVTFDRWVTGSGSAWSGATYVYSRWAGTRLDASFTGDTVRWIGPKQPSYGKADVYIDGVKKTTVDCYEPVGSATLSSTLFEATGMTDGPHTISVRLTGAKNPASSGNVVVVDTFEIEGAAPAGSGTRLNEQGGHATFSGTWIKSANPTYTSSSYAYSRWAGASYKATFTGTKVAWVGPKNSNYGYAKVYIDGVLKGTVDCYGTMGWRYKIWESAALTPGTHTIEIKPTGTKRAAATSTIVVIDAIDVTP